MIRRLAVASLALALLSLALSATAGAAVTVSNQNDSGPGSLREAIAKAPSGETIVVPAGTYTLSSGTIKIVTKNLTIEGHGEADTIIRAQMGESMFEIFKSTVSFSGLTMREARIVQSANAAGGAVLGEAADLTFKSVAILDNSAITNGGNAEKGGFAIAGGIGVGEGSLTIIDSTIAGNTVEANGGAEAAGGQAIGAGIYYTGPQLTIETPPSAATAPSPAVATAPRTPISPAAPPRAPGLWHRRPKTAP